MYLFNLTIDIKFCHISYHEKDWCERKTKCDYTIWNVISGGLALEMNEQTLYAKSGDVILFHPGDTYKAWCYGDDHCYFLVTFFSLSTGNAVDLLTVNSTAGLYSNEYISKISRRFCDEYQVHYNKPDASELGLYAAFLTFFSDLSTQFGTQTPFITSTNTLSDNKLLSLLKYIDDNAEKKITVKDMADFMNMSDKYFSSYFHLHIGMSPKQYLKKCRMMYAMLLLSDSNCSLAEIASRLNFADQYCFSKAFKNFFGESPGKFRRSTDGNPFSSH